MLFLSKIYNYKSVYENMKYIIFGKKSMLTHNTVYIIRVLNICVSEYTSLKRTIEY